MAYTPNRQEFINYGNGETSKNILDYFETLNILVEQLELTTDANKATITNLATTDFVMAMTQDIVKFGRLQQRIDDLEQATYGYNS